LSIPFHLQIPRRLYEEMVSQAIAELPNECCGVFTGYLVEEGSVRLVGRVMRRYPLTNEAASPREYRAAPFAPFRDNRTNGMELLAIYHSHPTSEPVPSRTDLERNDYGPEVVNFIVSLKDGEPRVRGWWLEGNGYREAEWECLE
jgi:[CysO sulfur-carrier protein]-S-L-cysteine hydrolase